jgi:hypothetical protein
VGDHENPLGEFGRLAIWHRDVAPMLPTRPNPSGLTDLDQIEAGWVARGLTLRLRRSG